MAADRFNIGNYAISEVVNAALDDIGLLQPKYALTASKVARSHERNRKVTDTISKEQHLGSLSAIFFDGRKDWKTLYSDPSGSRGYKEKNMLW